MKGRARTGNDAKGYCEKHDGSENVMIVGPNKGDPDEGGEKVGRYRTRRKRRDWGARYTKFLI